MVASLEKKYKDDDVMINLIKAICHHYYKKAVDALCHRQADRSFGTGFAMLFWDAKTAPSTFSALVIKFSNELAESNRGQQLALFG